jgi:DNA repair protein RadC
MPNLVIPNSESSFASPGGADNHSQQTREQHGELTNGRAALSFVREVSVNYRGPRRARSLIRMARDAADFIRKVMPDNSREHLVALFLDGSHRVVAFSVISTGTANQTLVQAREVSQPAILVGAIAVVVGHNHPSGECFPSGADDVVTGNLKEAGRLLGIELLDHVIVCDDAFYSYSESGSL